MSADPSSPDADPSSPDAVSAALDAIAATETNVGPSSPRSSTPRWRRANNLIGVIIPPLLAALFASGYHVAIRQVSPWLQDVCGRPLLAFFYRLTCRFLFFTLSYTFFCVYAQPRGHSRPLKEPPRAILERSAVFECADFDATVPRCNKDGCRGSWVPARARHCRDCGFCTLAFDHCCPWFGPACISATSTQKPFLLFMLSAVLLISIGAAPLVPLVRQQVGAVLATSWSSDIDYVNERWWSRKRSWAFGPVWRYMGGLIYAYQHHRSLNIYTPHPTVDPSLLSLFVLVFVTLVLLVGVSMLAISVRNILLGRTTLEIERAVRSRGGKVFDARRYLWIPLEPPAEGDEDRRWSGAVVRVRPETPIYDLGPTRNWRALMGESWIDWLNPHYSPASGTEWKLNEKEVEKLTEAAKKGL